jgi:hypothetical protein
MDLAMFEKLNEHLSEVKPIIVEFCTGHGYAFVNAQSIGRFPRIRIEKFSPIHCWIDLWMSLDKTGNRYEVFFSEVPYDLYAGASVILPTDDQRFVRHQLTFQVWCEKPFLTVPAELLAGLRECHLRLTEWDRELLIQTGDRIQLRAESKADYEYYEAKRMEPYIAGTILEH